MRRRPPASLWLPAAVLLLVAAVTAARAVDVLGGRLLTAHAERGIHAWAAGDRRLDERLAAAAPALPPGIGVRLVVPAGTEEGWATFHGLYHLPQQRVMGVHQAGAPPPPADAWIVDVTGPVPRVTAPDPAGEPTAPGRRRRVHPPSSPVQR